MVRCDTVAAWAVTSHQRGPDLISHMREVASCERNQGDASGRRVVAPRRRGASRSSGRRRWLSPVALIITGFTVIGLGLRLFLLSRPGYLLGVTQYDDGPYFGSALRLVHGVLPYRDFIIVQPPGITLLMSPAALLAQVTGTAWGMAAGRLLTVAASAAGIVLVGLLARHRGPLAVALSCGVLAIFPGSLVAAHTVLLEPWVTLFCLIGAVAVLDRDQFARSGGGCCGAGWRSGSPARSKCGPSSRSWWPRCSWPGRSAGPCSSWPGWRSVSASRSSRSLRLLRAGSTTASSRPRCSASCRPGPRCRNGCG